MANLQQVTHLCRNMLISCWRDPQPVAVWKVEKQLYQALKQHGRLWKTISHSYHKIWVSCSKWTKKCKTSAWSFWSVVQEFSRQCPTTLLVLYAPQSDLKCNHECARVSAYSHACWCVCLCVLVWAHTHKRDYTSLLYIFYVLVLDTRCQLPTHTHSLQPKPVSVFITSRLWTVKNRKCFFPPPLTSVRKHTHAHTPVHATSVTPFLFQLPSVSFFSPASHGLPHPLCVPKKA